MVNIYNGDILNAKTDFRENLLITIQNYGG